MTDNEWTTETLKKHFDQMLADRDRAVSVALSELERRLTALDEAIRQKERDFYSRDQHETFARQQALDLDSIRNEMRDHHKPKWALWATIAGLAIALVAAQWTLAIRPYDDRLRVVEENQKIRLSEHHAERLHAVETAMATHKGEEENNKSTIALVNSRIDRLYDLYRDLNDASKKLPLGKRSELPPHWKPDG